MSQPDLRALGQIYRHTQRATVILWALAGGAALDGVIVVGVLRGAPTAVLAITGSVFLVIGACAWLFRSLSVEVTSTHVRLWFGPGLIHKTFPVAEIVAVEVVRNRWYYGWGIRLTPHGWLFNVSGLDAVQIRLRNDRHYRIGTDQPQELAESIRSAMGTGY